VKPCKTCGKLDATGSFRIGRASTIPVGGFFAVPRSQDLSFLGLAVGLHAVTLALAWVAPASDLAVALREERAPIQAIEIEVERRIEPPGATRTDDVRPLPQQRKRSPLRTFDDRRAPSDPRALVTEDDPDETTDAPSEPDEGWSLAVPGADALAGDGGLGSPFAFGTAPIYAAPGMMPLIEGPAPAPTTVRKRAVDRDIATKVLTGAQKARDKALGLDLPAAGTVAAAVKNATYSSAVGGTAAATIAVQIGPSGAVRSVRVAGAQGGSAAAWAGVASATRAALAGQQLAMIGAYKKGALVVVHVQSRMQSPSGKKVDSEGPSLGTSFTFDVADIGARPKRVVSTSFSTQPL